MTIEVESVARLLDLRQQKTKSEECPGMAQVASVAAGAAGPDEILAAAQHLETCESCRQVAKSFSDMSGSKTIVRSQTQQPAPLWRRPAWAMAMLLLFSGTLALLWSSWSNRVEQPDQADFILKGAPDSLAVAVERGQHRFVAQPGDGLQIGDQLGFFYTSQAGGFLAVLDLEKSGHSTVIYPMNQPHSQAIEAGAEIALPDNIKIKEIEDCEWLVAVFSDQTYSISDLRAHLRTAAEKTSTGCKLRLSLPEARSVWIFPLRSEP